ncbi:MAG: GIY-YIG nuclease family protein [Patescibacteria group bacterium]|nr:GIY-YIG nuclease family protein [Patescibacteria group bacterium]
MFYTYILKSLSVNKFYFGSTKDLTDRLKSHNTGKVKFTKPFRPWIIHYFETFPSRSEAYRENHNKIIHCDKN